MHGWHREPTDGSKGGWGSDFLLSLSLSLFLSLSLSLSRALRLFVFPSFQISIDLSWSICLSIYLFVQSHDLMIQNATFLRNPQEISALTSEHVCLLYCACHAKYISADPLQTSHACHRFCNWCKTHKFDSLLRKCRIHCVCHAKTDPSLKKCSETARF